MYDQSRFHAMFLIFKWRRKDWLDQLCNHLFRKRSISVRFLVLFSKHIKQNFMLSLHFHYSFLSRLLHQSIPFFLKTNSPSSHCASKGKNLHFLKLISFLASKLSISFPVGFCPTFCILLYQNNNYERDHEASIHTSPVATPIWEKKLLGFVETKSCISSHLSFLRRISWDVSFPSLNFLKGCNPC